MKAEMSIKKDSTALYHACKSGDIAQQQAAYESVWRYLYQIAAYMLRTFTDGDALAQDCAQKSLLRIHEKIDTLNEPKSFLGWSRKIVSHIVIDEMRKQKRLTHFPEDDEILEYLTSSSTRRPTEIIAQDEAGDEIRRLLNQSPMSARSKRVVVGRYVDELPDEALSETESQLAGGHVRPSHIQVTRSKNMNKLRDWQPLLDYLNP